MHAVTPPSAIAVEDVCLHCGLPASAGRRFCCAGCESVHDLLIARGLGHFYTLRDEFSFRKPAAVSTTELGLGASESTDLVRGQPSVRFYLEGIHCLGCLWLLEKLPSLDPTVAEAKLDMAHQILEVSGRGPTTDWAAVAALIAQLGYQPRLLSEGTAESLRRADFRWQLARLGVAAFAAGNIMLLSVSIYGGTGKLLGLSFGWLSLFLAVPSLTFSAWPLYRSALLPLRRGQLSVDLAIVLALLAGTGMSLWSLLRGTADEIYFDSLTMLVFLLLSSRFLLMRIREQLAREGAYLSFLSGTRYDRLSPLTGRVAADHLRPGDLFRLRATQPLPADAVLASPEAHFDLSLLTGESLPVSYRAGDRVEAGAVLLTEEAELIAEREAAESRLARILDQIRAYELKRSPSLDFADRMGRYFVGVVLTLAAGLLLMYPSEEGWRRALALVIVTCPCVLAFAVPLAFARAAQIAARRGILFVSPEKLEALAEARTLFLDKTGTLTNGQFAVNEWTQVSGDRGESEAMAHALERRSGHPVGKAIARFTSGARRDGAEIEDLNELPHFGVRGRLRGQEWSMGRTNLALTGANTVELRRGSELRALVRLGDSVRPEAKEVVEQLSSRGLDLRLLSGDHAGNVGALAGSLGLTDWRAGLSPEEKAEIVRATPNAVMVGDGANDAIAFRGAAVGIAMAGAVELSIRHADVVLTKPGLGSLADAIRLAQGTMRTVRVNFAITLAYNLTAGSLAAAGLMSPLLAAVLMPASALSVFVFTQWRGQRAFT